MKILELFSGSGTVSSEFERAGHEVFSIDIRKRKGICEPTLRKNVLDVSIKDIPFKEIDVIWASPPCDIFSKASGGFHLTKNNIPRTEKGVLHLKILRKCLALIQKLKPKLFFIENPDGAMKFQREIITFLVRNNAMIKKLDYSAYGFPLPKATNLFTNALDFEPKSTAHDFDPKERAIFDNLTKCQRQKVPRMLAVHIVKYCEGELE